MVTPLISLMKDQTDRLRELGIGASYLRAAMQRYETSLIFDKCRYGKIDVLYVSPEKLQSRTFLENFRQINVSLIVVDEAHCISQWGYDFRPSYLKITELRNRFPDAPVLALTASATTSLSSSGTSMSSRKICYIKSCPRPRAQPSYIPAPAGARPKWPTSCVPEA